jgi:hypothetical protein
MGLFPKRKGAGEETKAGVPRAVMASAVPLSGPGVRAVSMARGHQTTEAWQRDAWYFYDALGEFRAPVNWIANAVSKADIYAAEVDPETGLVTGPTDNAQAQQAAVACLGGIAQRAQLQYILAVCWQVPGEAFVIIRPRPNRRGQAQPDEWLILSGQKVKPNGDSWQYQDPSTALWVTLGANDRMIRVWSPHPNDQSKADTAARAALPVMREIEKSSASLAATLDSRLSTAGVWAFPQEMDFPRGDGQSLAEALSDYFVEAASASLSNPGTAEARVPIILTMPSEMISPWQEGKIEPNVTLDQAVIDLRQADLSRLASALDMPKAVAEGTQADMNHWSAWNLDESTYKLFIAPLLDRLGDALTEHWYLPVLEAMGVADPERYVLAWNTEGIVSRPDSTEDMNWLYERRLISDDYRRQASGIPDDAIPVEDEVSRRFIESVVVGAPTLLGDPTVAELLNLPEIAPAAVGVAPGDVVPAGEVSQSEQTANDAANRELPAAPADSNDVPDGLVAAAELIVFDALSRAGGRLLTREHRGQFANTPKHELHTVIQVDSAQLGRLMEGSFEFADRVSGAFGRDPQKFRTTLLTYVGMLLCAKAPHNRDDLIQVLK